MACGRDSEVCFLLQVCNASMRARNPGITSRRICNCRNRYGPSVTAGVSVVDGEGEEEEEDEEEGLLLLLLLAVN